jgi:hypothetical protein
MACWGLSWHVGKSRFRLEDEGKIWKLDQDDEKPIERKQALSEELLRWQGKKSPKKMPRRASMYA